MSDASAPPTQGTLASAAIEAAGPPVRRATLYVLHGMYGRGRNWSVVARQLVAARPDWRARLVDLRGHGDSGTATPPHTVSAAAADVARLAEAIGEPIDAVLGHSFGGKVALALAGVVSPAPRQIWLIDSSAAPRASDGSAARMLALARRHPGPFSSRDEAADAIEAGGFARPVAAWMASNLARSGNQYQWRLDFDVMQALLDDFARTDLWPTLETPPPGVAVHVVKAASSSLIDDAARARIVAAHERHGRVHFHEVSGGHWLNTDNPQAVVALLARELPEEGGAGPGA